MHLVEAKTIYQTLIVTPILSNLEKEISRFLLQLRITRNKKKNSVRRELIQGKVNSQTTKDTINKKIAEENTNKNQWLRGQLKLFLH